MSTTSPAVLITVPKYVAITPLEQCTSFGSNKSALPKIRPATQIIVRSLTEATSPTDMASEPRGKKRRLDHLTWEEKVQRKKLKNRVAAQTSRDRKKARMEEMENEIKDLTEKTEILENKCQSLQMINDSLLEKNQKLDMELELVRQQLNELQKRQQQQQQQQEDKVTSCAGSGLNPQGLTDVAGIETEKESNCGLALASDSSLPALQDMLLSDIGIEQEESLDSAGFDACKLEELAESLLADITADLEASNRTSNASFAQITSRTERLPGSVVGTTSEFMEPSEHTKEHNNCLEKPNEFWQTPYPKTLEKAPASQSDLNSKNNIEGNSTPETNILTNHSSDTIYGTYDAKTNSITIVMDDVAVPVNEAVEEIYCEGVSSDASMDGLLYTSSTNVQTNANSSPHVYLSRAADVSDEEFEEDNLNLDRINFFCPKRSLISPLPKSPTHSAISDHGYESIIGSPPKVAPPSPRYDALINDISDFNDWSTSLNELFPSLM